ncbi:unnamed protein product [Prorocentrum cordatum]|uniref:H(+)-exporting diphosphatase n=1 Tax=Prorocentrum cordatum TaxID=2364126 RepID=A0ABN9V2Q2_9DINO|nr:unnamed protein product [Polarella glacialis]
MASLVLLVLFMIGGVQSGCAIFDTCNQGFLAISAISYNQCSEMGNSIAAMGASHATFLSGLLVIARVETTLFLGMGDRALYALAFLHKGTSEVAVVHLIIAVWAVSVCLVYAHGAGVLSYTTPEPNVYPVFHSSDLFFIIPVTGSFGAVFFAVFFPCSSVGTP